MLNILKEASRKKEFIKLIIKVVIFVNICFLGLKILPKRFKKLLFVFVQCFCKIEISVCEKIATHLDSNQNKSEML
jgi:hypothetical protein